MNENALSVDEIAQIVGDANFAAHQDEAEGRYGGTDDWAESGPVRKLLTVCLCGCCPGRLV